MGDIAKRVQGRRTELGLSASETARRTKISPAYLHKIEHADRDVAMSANVLFALSRVLETTPAYLQGVDPAEAPPPVPPEVLDYMKEPGTDPRLAAAVAAASLQNGRHELTRENLIAIARVLIEIKVLPADTPSQRRAATRLAELMVDEAIAREERGRDRRIADELLGLTADAAFQVPPELRRRRP